MNEKTSNKIVEQPVINGVGSRSHDLLMVDNEMFKNFSNKRSNYELQENINFRLTTVTYH